MNIRFTVIEHNHLYDAPFVGARVSGIKCSMGCPGCHNQHLRSAMVHIIDSEELLDRIESDPFDEGIILGGLEWTEQPEEMLELVKGASRRGMKVMIYTGLTEERFLSKFGVVHGLWVKYGGYMKEQSSVIFEGIQLASSNQYIKHYDKYQDYI